MMVRDASTQRLPHQTAVIRSVSENPDRVRTLLLSALNPTWRTRITYSPAASEGSAAMPSESENVHVVTRCNGTSESV